MYAVIFDCDGVLVDSEVIALEIETAALVELGASALVNERVGAALRSDRLRKVRDDERALAVVRGPRAVASSSSAASLRGKLERAGLLPWLAPGFVGGGHLEAHDAGELPRAGAERVVATGQEAAPLLERSD